MTTTLVNSLPAIAGTTGVGLAAALGTPGDIGSTIAIGAETMNVLSGIGSRNLIVDRGATPIVHAVGATVTYAAGAYATTAALGTAGPLTTIRQAAGVPSGAPTGERTAHRGGYDGGVGRAVRVVRRGMGEGSDGMTRKKLADRYRVVDDTSVRASSDPDSPEYETWLHFPAGSTVTAWPDHADVAGWVKSGHWVAVKPRKES